MSLESVMKALDRFEGYINQIGTGQRELADRVLSLEQRGATSPLELVPGDSGGIGARVVKAFDANRELFEKTRSVRLEFKAATDPITTANGRTVIAVGVGSVTGGVLGLQNAFRTRGAGGTSAVEYSRFQAVAGAAAVQAAEGDSKAAVRPEFALITQSAITVAGVTKMSRQALADSSELRGAVDTTLNRSVATAVDAALVNGVVAPAFEGFEALATPYTSLVYDTIPDAVSEAVATMQVAGFAPDVVALNPADWLAVTVAKGAANDHYLSGSYLGPLPTAMRGLRVVLSPSIDAGKALVLDTSHSELLVVDGFSVEIGYVNDDFTKNLVTLLGEVRVIPVFRTVGSARLITPKA